ncbi:DUF4177 domain-containing protein [uncultured Shimia sp.]|uniref:DUF4177 domain-containing protein n=1 Tax=uncultured Shimia sp. TaxID=573152 RepID=UPI00261F0CBF|nr:DUF4177 domain-containing protein [uncultured Shimia sp.]
MTAWEYKVVAAPAKGQKARGVKGPEARFAYALESVMNQMASEGWEFQRTETLPSEERSGLTSSTTTYRNVMVFRRPRKDDISAFRPKLLERPAYEELPAPELASADAEPDDTTPAPSDEPVFHPEAGEEEPSGFPTALKTRARTVEPDKDQDTDESEHAAQ